jgi:multidrug efflux pump subunit AcrB
VIIDMPEGTTLERTSAVTKEIAQYLSTKPQVVNYQNYIGTSAPITFNGLVRHYDLRSGSNMADIQVNLLHKGSRTTKSRYRQRCAAASSENRQKIWRKCKIVEVPPGPPVLSTLVAEVYGPNYKGQIKVAKQVKEILHKTDGVVDIDWTVEANQTEYKLVVERKSNAERNCTATNSGKYLFIEGISYF